MFGKFDIFWFNCGLGLGLINLICTGVIPISVQQTITINTGLRFRFGFGSLPCYNQQNLKKKNFI